MAHPSSRVNYIWQIRFPRIFAFGNVDEEREQPVGSEIESSPLRSPRIRNIAAYEGRKKTDTSKGKVSNQGKGGERKRAAARTRCHSFPAHNAYRHNAWFYAIVCAARGTSVCIGLHACRTNTCVRAYGLSDSHLFRSRLRHAQVSILLSFSLSSLMDLPFSLYRFKRCVCLPRKYAFLTLESKCQIIFKQKHAIAPREK